MQFITDTPYDIYGDNLDARSPFMRFMDQPAMIAGSFATDMFLIPSLANPDRMKNAMGASQWATYKSNALKQYGSASDRHLRRLAVDSPRNMSTVGGKGFKRSSLWPNQWRAEHKWTKSLFGQSASTRMSLLRTASGASRFVSAYFIGQLGISAIRGITDMVGRYEAPEPKLPRHRDIETGGMYVDTRAAQTQRQRAIQAIHNTQLSTRAALSNEASFMHFQR